MRIAVDIFQETAKSDVTAQSLQRSKELVQASKSKLLDAEAQLEASQLENGKLRELADENDALHASNVSTAIAIHAYATISHVLCLNLNFEIAVGRIGFDSHLFSCER